MMFPSEKAEVQRRMNTSTQVNLLSYIYVLRLNFLGPVFTDSHVQYFTYDVPQAG